MKLSMRRDTFGNLIIGVFTVYLLCLFVNRERFHQSETASVTSVLLSACYQTAFALGGFICLALIGLHLSRKSTPPRVP